MPARFIDVVVDAHDDIPDGCTVRFQAVSEARPVHVLLYQPPLGPAGLFRVEGRSGRGATQPARAAAVEIHGQGPVTLVWGGNLGLRLWAPASAAGERSAPGENARALPEPYLLVAPQNIIS